MIPDEAVEAAARAALGRNLNKRTLELILEAAAPHMFAPLVADLDKWAGRSKSGFYDEAQDDVVQILNPYRSQA